MRIRTSVVATIGVALALSACASTSDGGGASTSGSPSASTTEAVALSWRTRPDNQAEADVYASVSKTITEKGVGLKLTYQAGNSEGSPYQDKLKTELAAGTAPDVFWIPGTDVADFAKAGLILNFADQAKAQELNKADFYDGPIASLAVDPATGQPAENFLWGIPRDVSTFALYLNLDLLDKSGAEDPRELAKNGKWTWEKFAEVAQKMTEKGGAGVKGFGAGGWWANWGYFVNSGGGSFFNEDRTACNLDSAGSIAGLTFFKSIYDKGYAVKFGEDAEPPFKSGKVGMFLNGRWATPGTREIKDFGWDVVAAPSGPAPGKGWQFWGAYVVNAKTANPEAAVKLVKELTSAEVQNKIASLGANIPSRKGDDVISSFLKFTPPTNNQAFVEGITNNPVPEGPLWKGNWPEFDKISGDSVTAVMSGKKTIAEFASTICKDTAVAFKG